MSSRRSISRGHSRRGSMKLGKKPTKKRKAPKFCVGDKVLVSYIEKEYQGIIKFHGPINEKKKGLVVYYGVELGDGEGESEGTFNDDGGRVYFSTAPNSKSAVFLKQKHLLKVLTPINGKRLVVGDRVLVAGRGNGVIKFIGPTYFGPHLWYGIHLDDKIGRNNGMLQKRRYFACPDMHGVFVREEKITPLGEVLCAMYCFTICHMLCALCFFGL